MRVRRVIAAAVLSALVGVAPASAASISLESRLVQPNELFTVAVEIRDVVDLFAYSFDVTFDPAVLTLVAVQEGEFLARSGATLPCTYPGLGEGEFACPSEPGMVSVGNATLGLPVSDQGLGGVLTNLQFLAAASGSTNLTLSLIALADAFGTTLDPVTAAIRVDTPTPVPEPSTLALLGIGAAALARTRRRRR
jgi:hypothetical protein